MKIARATLLLLMTTTASLQAQKPVMSMPHGFYDEPFSLEIGPEEEDSLYDVCRIRYTLDGSAPTAQSPIYSKTLLVQKNTIVRAAYERADTLASEISTATYLFMKDVLAAPDVPSGYPSTWGSYCQISGTAKGDYGMDPELTGNATLKPKIEAGLLGIPTLSIVTDKNNLFSHTNDSLTGGIYIYTGTPVGDGTGRDWERPVSIELFDPEGKEDLTVNCGTKIHGGHSRLAEKTPKHSFRLMFKTRFGGPSKLKYKLFGKEGPKKYDQLVLRCMFGNTWTHWDGTNRKRAQYQRDMWARATQGRMGHPHVRGKYVNLYLNGMYWGIYNIAERVNDYYCSSNFDGEKEDYDVIKVEEDHTGHDVVAADGNMEKWNEMFALIDRAATSNADYFQLIGCNSQGEPDTTVEKLLDVDNFIDYMLINQYGGNDDWDQHNWLAFRNREKKTEGFRFLCWDTEIIFTTNDYNALDVNNSKCPSRIMNKLAANPNFLHRYYDHAYRHLEQQGGIFTPDVVRQVWDSLYEIIHLPLYAESARWGDYRRDVHRYSSNSNTVYTVDKEFMTERNRLIDDYFPKRSGIVINQLKNKGWYSKEAAPHLKINGTLDATADTLRYGDVLQIQKKYTVLYTIDGSDPVTWATSKSGTTGVTSQIYQSGHNILDDIDWSADTLTLRAIIRNATNYSPTVTWRFVLDHSTSIRELATEPQEQPQEGIYDLSGRFYPEGTELQPGIYLRNGKKVIIK